MERDPNCKVEMISGRVKELDLAGKIICCAKCGIVVDGDDWVFPFPILIETTEFPPRTVDVCFCADCMKRIMYGELQLVSSTNATTRQGGQE